MAHFLRLSPTMGINLDAILAWTEETTSVPETIETTTGPRQTYRYEVPCIRVDCRGGQRYTYTDAERLTLLAYFEAAAMPIVSCGK